MYENAFTEALLDWIEGVTVDSNVTNVVVVDEVVSDDDPLAPWNLL